MMPLILGATTYTVATLAVTASPAAPLRGSIASATFAAPVLVGSSNASTPAGSAFWFPAISIPTGLKGHVAQHITLSGDGGTCPRAGHPDQFCEQIMLTKDGGQTYDVVRKLKGGTSGNFDGYGDLGAWVPAKAGATHPAGEFSTLVGCNDCRGGTLQKPNYLQTWVDDGTTLKLTKNVSVTFSGFPSTFDENLKCGGGKFACGFTPPDQNIVRTSNGKLLAAFYGHAADGYKNGTMYTTAFFASQVRPVLQSCVWR